MVSQELRSDKVLPSTTPLAICIIISGIKMLLEFSVLVASTFLLLMTLRANYFPPKRLPPGPLRLPLLGSALFGLANFNLHPIVMMKRLVDRYGPIVHLELPGNSGVIIGELEAAKSALGSEVWEPRPDLEIIGLRSWGLHLGIAYGNGDAWREMRRFSLRTFRNVGNSTNINRMMEESLQTLVEKLDAIADQSEVLQVRRFFSWPVLQVMWSMLYSVRTAAEEEKLRGILPLMEEYSEDFLKCGRILHVLPWLRHIAPDATGFTYFQDGVHKVQTTLKGLLDYRRSEFCDNETKRDDWIDAFIANMEKREMAQGDPNLKHYTEQQFITSIADLLLGGAETTNNALEFAIYFVSGHPKVQKRIQEEIDRVVGRGRLPNMGDKSMMPYTEATLTEVNRIANTLPMIPRCTTEDTMINGYFVKKGTPAIINLYSVHMSSKVWGDPYTFRPERFLNKDGQLDTGMLNKVIAFGGGRRQCIAETWARATLFTYLTGLLQNFTFEFENTDVIVDDESLNSDSDPESIIFQTRVKTGFTLYPQPYEVKITRR